MLAEREPLASTPRHPRPRGRAGPSSARRRHRGALQGRKERVVDRFERAYLEALLAWAGGNVSRAARKAKIDRMYLHRLLQRHAVRRESMTDE